MQPQNQHHGGFSLPTIPFDFNIAALPPPMPPPPLCPVAATDEEEEGEEKKMGKQDWFKVSYFVFNKKNLVPSIFSTFFVNLKFLHLKATTTATE